MLSAVVLNAQRVNVAQTNKAANTDSFSRNKPPASLGVCGLGLRREFFQELLDQDVPPVDFLEIAPENWIGMGGRRGKLLKAYSERYPMVCHGLSLSIGSIAPLNPVFLKQLKDFFTEHKIQYYSEHLSYCSDEKGYLYDLMPIPFTCDAVHYLSNRIIQVQETLERKIILENISYYAIPKGELTEAEFINAVLAESNCELLLDVNNVYVNSVNHGYCPYEFIRQMPADKIVYLHMAGHWKKEPDLIIDTHGDTIVKPVWDLLSYVYKNFGIIPTLLERDNDVPSLGELIKEITHLKSLQEDYKRVVDHVL